MALKNFIIFVKKEDLVFLTARVMDTSDTSVTRLQHEQH